MHYEFFNKSIKIHQEKAVTTTTTEKKKDFLLYGKNIQKKKET